MDSLTKKYDTPTLSILALLSVIEIILNGIAVIFNRVTTFCIADVIVFKSSRFIQILTMIFCILGLGVYTWGNRQILQMMIPGSIILFQIGLIIYIFLIEQQCFSLIFSGLLAFGCSILSVFLSAVQIYNIRSFLQKNKVKLDVTSPN